MIKRINRVLAVIVAVASFVVIFNVVFAVNVQATTPVDTRVSHMYSIALNRVVETQKVKDWSAKLGSGELTAADFARELLFSEEFKDRGLEDSEYIKVLTQVLLNRMPKETELVKWTSLLEAGATRLYILS